MNIKSNKIMVGDIWSTYVLVSKYDNELWYTMNTNINKLLEVLKPGTKIQKWTYYRGTNGDTLQKKTDVIKY